jgi:hypothetical protein
MLVRRAAHGHPPVARSRSVLGPEGVHLVLPVGERPVLGPATLVVECDRPGEQRIEPPRPPLAGDPVEDAGVPPLTALLASAGVAGAGSGGVSEPAFYVDAVLYRTVNTPVIRIP